jgi:hypothetical protein
MSLRVLEVDKTYFEQHSDAKGFDMVYVLRCWMLYPKAAEYRIPKKSKPAPV